MTTTASLESPTVQLDPGSEAVIPLQIKNNGTVVEGYDITVVGVPASWATVEPAQVSLYPGTATTATVTFRPPRSATTVVGSQRFGVVITPRDNPNNAVVPEGVVEILPFLDTTAELVPRTSQGRRGKHQVAIDNRGNVPVNVLVTAGSEGNRARLSVDPVGLIIPPGEARFTKVRAKGRRAIWRGQPVTHNFVVEVTPENSTPVDLEGSYVQTPVIPKWLIWALIGLILLAAALIALWFTLLKPTIESQAKEAAEEAAADAEKAAGEAKKNAEAANGAATNAQKSADKADQIAGEKPPPKVILTDVSRRLHVDPLGGGGTDAQNYDIAGDGVYRLTDVVLSNPQGDFGRAVLVVDGEVQMDVALENFRDLDFHFVSPIVANERIRLVVTCRTPGTPPDAPPATRCDTSALLGGELSVPSS